MKQTATIRCHFLQQWPDATPRVAYRFVQVHLLPKQDPIAEARMYRLGQASVSPHVRLGLDTQGVTKWL